MSTTSGPVKEAKQTVTMQPSQPMLEILTLPSTSKGQSKEDTSPTTQPAKKISHTIPVPMTAADGTVKYIHIAPLASLPKHSLASVKKLPPGSKPELSMSPKLEIPKQVLVATNVRPIKLATTMHVGPIKSLGTVLEAQPVSETQLTPRDKEANKGQSSNLPIITNCISIANREEWQHFMAEFKKVRQINSNPVKQIKNTSTQIKNTSKPSSNTSKPISNTSKQISNTSKQIKNTSKQISNTSKQISNTSKQISNTSKQISNTSNQNKNTSKSTVKEKTSLKTITETVPKSLEDNTSPARQAKPLSKKTFSKKPKSKDKSPPESPQTNNSPKKKVPKERTEVSMYVADGFREDVEDLLEKCLEVSKLNFDKFANIWREMDFSCIFHDRQSSAELAELSEEFIHIAKYHMLARNVSFEENVAGLFLVYALLNLQPYERFAALRLVPDDVPAVLRLEAEARRQKRHDVLYILGNVLIKGPCQFHVLAREVAIEPAIRKYYDGTVRLTNASDTVLTRNAECVPILKELSSLEQRARQLREKLRERHAGKDIMSNLCKRPATQLLELFKEHTARGQQAVQLKNKNIDKVLKSKSEEDRAQLLRAIKDRAMCNVVDPMKHLTSVEERQLTDDSTTDESEIIPVKRTKLKRKAKYKGKGRGRSSATNLRDLFSCDETADEASVPEYSRKEMPILDDTTEDRDSDYSQDEQKPKIKISKHKTKSKNTDDKRKGKKNSPVAKKKTGKKNVVDFSDPYLDLMNVEDLVPPEDTTEVNLNISMDPISEDEEVTNKTIKGNDIETLLNSPNGNKRTSTKIEIEVIDNEVQTKAETGNIQEDKKVSRVPKNQKAMTSKNTTNSNTISPKCVRRKTNPKLVPRTKKADINKKEKDDTPNASLDERSGSTETLKSPTRRKTYPAKHSSNKSSLESIKSPMTPKKKEVLSVNKEQEDQLTPKIKKESPKEKDVDSPGTPRTKKQSPRKTDVESPGTPRTKKESPRKKHVGSPGTTRTNKKTLKNTDVGSLGTPSKKKESPKKTDVRSPGAPSKKKDLSKNEEEKSITKSSPRKRSNTCVDKADAKKCKMDPDLILNTK